MAAVVRCPTCGERYDLDPHMAGKRIQCGRCLAICEVPATFSHGQTAPGGSALPGRPGMGPHPRWFRPTRRRPLRRSRFSSPNAAYRPAQSSHRFLSCRNPGCRAIAFRLPAAFPWGSGRCLWRRYWSWASSSARALHRTPRLRRNMRPAPAPRRLRPTGLRHLDPPRRRRTRRWQDRRHHQRPMRLQTPRLQPPRCRRWGRSLCRRRVRPLRPPRRPVPPGRHRQRRQLLLPPRLRRGGARRLPRPCRRHCPRRARPPLARAHAPQAVWPSRRPLVRIYLRSRWTH
jgi:hypothetical protein